MKSFKDFKSSLVTESIAESEDGNVRLNDDDIEFEIDNNDVEDVLDTEADTFMIDEDAITTIKSIVKDKQAKSIKFSDGKSMKVDMTTANVLLKVIDALNDANKDKFIALVNKSKDTFAKAVEFSWKAAK
jgi:hypothetical protein